ncbi:uncharacterized protein FTOL_13749 [Fusarium torulosum]|jgi:hypothetical protein
MALVK